MCFSLLVTIDSTIHCFDSLKKVVARLTAVCWKQPQFDKINVKTGENIIFYPTCKSLSFSSFFNLFFNLKLFTGFGLLKICHDF